MPEMVSGTCPGGKAKREARPLARKWAIYRLGLAQAISCKVTGFRVARGHVALLVGLGCLLGCEAGGRGAAFVPMWFHEQLGTFECSMGMNRGVSFQVAAEIGREYRGKGSNLILGPSVQAPRNAGLICVVCLLAVSH